MTDEKQELTNMFLEYANQLESKILSLNQLLGELTQSFNEAKFQEFYRAVHNLKGSAGLYGYEEIHQIAAELDTKVKTISDVRQLTAEQPSISQTIDNLHQAWRNTNLEDQLKKFLVSMMSGSE